MRILHVTDTYLPTVGGVEILVHGLASRQAAAGDRVTVLTRTPAPHGYLDPQGVTVVRGRAQEPEQLRDVDVVHCHISAISPQSFLMSRAAAQAGVPVVVTIHSIWGIGWPIFRGIFTGGAWNRMPIQFAAVSEAAAVSVRHALGPGHQVLVLPNAIDTARWRPDQPRARDREVVITSVMRFERRKRPHALVRMLHDVRKTISADIPLRAELIGDGAQREEIQRGLEHWGMSSWVHLPGELDHPKIRDIYRSGDIYVAPAKLESFGLAALEARTAGLAVVARAGIGIGDFVTDGVDGLLATSDGDMADKTARLCRDRALLERIVEHNRRVTPPFDWSDVLWHNSEAYEIAAARTRAAHHS